MNLQGKSRYEIEFTAALAFRISGNKSRMGRVITEANNKAQVIYKTLCNVDKCCAMLSESIFYAMMVGNIYLSEQKLPDI